MTKQKTSDGGLAMIPAYKLTPNTPEQEASARRTAARYCVENGLGANDLAKLLDQLGLR